MLFRLVNGAREIAGFVHRVGVGKQQPRAAGALGAGPAGVGLAGEAAAVAQIQGRRSENDDALAPGSGGAGNIGRGVAGVVVDDDQLPLRCERESRLRLREQRIETGGERCGLVARRHDDGKAELRRQRWGGFLEVGRRAPGIVHRFVL